VASVAAAGLVLFEAVLITQRAVHPPPVRERTHVNFEVARMLGDLDVVRGDRVAVMRSTYGVYWARLAGVQIVAQLPQDGTTQFWQDGEDGRRSALTALAGTGAKVLLTASIPAGADLTGWIRLGETGWYAHPLRP
jgi:hypothetical protein